MAAQILLVLTGLALAGWGHVLINDLFGAAAAWVRLDERFPPAWRSSPASGGSLLLVMGAVCAFGPVLG